MTTLRPQPRIHHLLRCDRRAPLLQGLRTAPDGVRLAVTICTSCDGDDLVEQMRELARHDDGPEAA